jgi:hypothetical protein
MNYTPEQLLEVLKTVCETAAAGTRRWYLNGQLHRVDGPAVEFINGDKEWFLNGQPHRVDGPAIEWADGGKYWCLNGQLHRIDGPAFDDARGTKCWFLHGQELTEKEFNQKVKK